MKTRLTARPELLQMRQTNNSLLSVTGTDCELIISLLSFFTSLLLLSSCKNTAVNRKAAVFLCLFPCSRFGNNYFLIYSKFIRISVTHCRRRSGIITSELRKIQQTLYLAPGQLPGRNAHDSKVADKQYFPFDMISEGELI